MNKYLIIFEKTNTGYSAYSPDFDGCVAAGSTKKECEKNMKEAIQFHIESMIEKGYEVPQSSSFAAEFINLTIKKATKAVAVF
ncbi:MAG: type II toxin-antitoxin system HicB family antitoxin [bacterium]